MEKILGIDTGTNSLGWAIVERNESSNTYQLKDKGVHIFQEGVKIEKGIESSKAAERTDHRAIRKGYYRRKIRKIGLLRVLIKYGLCPTLSDNELRDWRKNKVYPKSDAFMNWQRTDDNYDKNPYHYRYICLNERLDLEKEADRYTLGRALYHINQRRGFLSNRKEQTDKNENGTVEKSISELTEDMNNAGCKYLGEYFYTLYKKGEKIRSKYTSREEHYHAEFTAICQKQGLPQEEVKELEHAIFYQRPLKSQKGLVGTCTFEKGKPRCSTSHPLYEEFRMYSFINNIKIKTPYDDELRPLTPEEKKKILPKFFRKSKRTFTFEDIAKELSTKKNYGYYKNNDGKQYKFNYHMDTTVAGCPVIGALKDIFGDDWADAICEVYTLAEGKTQLQIINDVWHALFFYSDESKLKEFAMNRLQLNDEDATKFSKISLPSEYASLSLKAITKILPYMKERGLIYSHATFLANLSAVVPYYAWEVKETRENIIDKLIDIIHGTEDKFRIEENIKAYLMTHFNLSLEELGALYHPSMIEAYPEVRPNDDGEYLLGSPRIASIKNPMAMRSMFRMRAVINRLLKEKKIDRDTIIHIEFARELNDANKRKAIKDLQRENEKERANAIKRIKETYKEETGQDIEPNEEDILKYLLWNEQDHICLYTGKTIRLSDFIGKDPKFDIEHTIPRSVGGDSTKMNLTLCDNHFNRDVKKAQLPQQLANIDEILQRIESWKERYEDLDKQIRKLRHAFASTKDAKDSIIQKRHKLTMQRDYWRGKYERFTMTEVPQGFSRRQGTDISVISKYARLYLKSLFKHVHVVKGRATSDFRKIWGIQEIYDKKDRTNHVHHCIDAVTIACISPYEYNKLAQYYHDKENSRWYGTSKAHFDKPWATFVEDIKKLQDEVLVAHYTADNVGKKAKRYIRLSNGKKILSQGDVARVSLHNDTYYGAIQKDDEIRYVVRKSLDTLEEKDINNIVDDVVRQKVEAAVKANGSLKNAVAAGIMMNEGKNIPIKKVRIYMNSVKNPLHIREHRDFTRHEYKRQYNVANDRNYLMGIYIGSNDKGKEKRSFKLVSNLTAANALRQSHAKQCDLIPLSDNNDYPLAYTLKIGTMVLLYENTASEVYEADTKELQRRLYKVSGLSSMTISGCDYGVIFLTHSQEARPSSEYNKKNGAYKKGEELRAGIKMLHTQIRALVQGYSFEINELGEIKFLHL